MMNKSGQGSIADTLTRYPNVFRTFDLSFMFHFYHKVIEYQSFKKMKHTTFMFHFKFHVSLFKTLRERFHAPSVF